MPMMMPVGTTIQVSPSPVVVLVLLVILGASCAVFWLLAQRWTTWRRWTAMREWAQAQGVTLQENPPDAPPQVLDVLPEDARITLMLQKDQYTALQVQTGATPAGQEPQHRTGWHLMVRELEVEWPPTGLRPSAHRASLLDLYKMSSYPSLIPPQRFVVFGTSGETARVLAEGQVRGLLPADIGLLLHGRHLVLDFSSRPFDPIELDRVWGVAEQLAAHLPVPSPAAS